MLRPCNFSLNVTGKKPVRKLKSAAEEMILFLPKGIRVGNSYSYSCTPTLGWVAPRPSGASVAAMPETHALQTDCDSTHLRPSRDHNRGASGGPKRAATKTERVREREEWEGRQHNSMAVSAAFGTPNAGCASSSGRRCQLHPRAARAGCSGRTSPPRAIGAAHASGWSG